jgi:hypothetical protein
MREGPPPHEDLCRRPRRQQWADDAGDGLPGAIYIGRFPKRNEHMGKREKTKKNLGYHILDQQEWVVSEGFWEPTNLGSLVE